MEKLKLNFVYSFLFALIFVSTTIAQTEDQERLIDDAERAKTAFITDNPEVEELFDLSVGYAIFPNVGKGAYILGGAAGNGVVYQDGNLIGFAELRQLDIGFQLGGQAFRQAILFQTQSELDKFKEGNYKLSGNASVVIIEEGKAKSVKFQNGRAILTMPKAGAMIEISVGGQKFDYKDLD
ncbi:MAG TPA: lipid-binding SYLF domain-containing protein [Salegentibacter sp.]|uniref:lipid-binding SYLF domain-containing protein n=1 Tax=Salegentibacter sp. TaxID=1903072 RepID=UPI002F95707F